MVTVISSSNRSQGNGLLFARQFERLIAQRTGQNQVQLLSLEELPVDLAYPEMYNKGGQHPEISNIQDTYLLDVKKWMFVVPEYNGSFPGILKLFLDACSVRHYAQTFQGKKAALVGVASGRGGNIRGMEHLTGILNYLGVNVMPHKLPISSLSTLLDNQKNITDTATQDSMSAFVDEFLDF